MGEIPLIVADIFVSSNLLNWNPVSFLIVISMGEIDLSCFSSDVMVAMLFVWVSISAGSEDANVVVVVVVNEHVSSSIEETTVADPRMPCIAFILKSERGSVKYKRDSSITN